MDSVRVNKVNNVHYHVAKSSTWMHFIVLISCMTNYRDNSCFFAKKPDLVSNIAMSEVKSCTQPLYHIAVLGLIWKWSFHGFTPSWFYIISWFHIIPGFHIIQWFQIMFRNSPWFHNITSWVTSLDYFTSIHGFTLFTLSHHSMVHIIAWFH